MFSPVSGMVAAALPVLLVWAGAVDALTSSIPNALVVLLAVCFALFAGATGISATAIFTHILCAGTILIGGFVLFSFSLLGGGDAKLLASAALWFGFENLLPFLASVALAGGALAATYLAADAIRAQFGLPLERPSTIPYGAAIATGALAVLPDWLAAF
jgi:prepilin peptidase CpaA